MGREVGGGWVATQLDDARDWCAGRSWVPRVVLLAVLAWIGVRHLAEPEYWSIFMGLTLAIHELGHVLWSPFGETLGVAGGSITQVAVPLVVALLLRRQRDWFGVAVGGAWLSYSLCNLATYIADAREGALPLVSLGGGDGEVIHDWNYLLDAAGWLQYDASIARAARFLAALILVASVAFGLWLCRRMATTPAPVAEG